MELRIIDESDPLHFIIFRDWSSRRETAKKKFLDAQYEVDNLVGRVVLDPVLISEVAKEAGAPHDLGGWALEEEGIETRNFIGQLASSDDELYRTLQSHCIGTALGRWGYPLRHRRAHCARVARPIRAATGLSARHASERAGVARRAC